MAANRVAIRLALKSLVENEMVGEGKLLQKVFGYLVADFNGQSPVMAIGSGGTDRKPLTFKGGRADYLLDVFIFVLYAETDEAGNLIKDDTAQPVWSEADSETMLDELEEQFGDFIHQQTNQKGAGWKSVTYAAPSTTEIVVLGGVPYRREYIQLRFGFF